MIAKELITGHLPPLKHTDTGELALRWMEEFKVSHLCVMKDENFVGVVSEVDIYDRGDPAMALTEMFDHLPRPYVLEHVHIYEVLARIAGDKISVVPVLSETEEYLGCIEVSHLMQFIAETGSIKEQGGIIVLEMNRHDYSLSQISQIVEGNNAHILSSFISSHPDSTKIEVTLKINQIELDRILRTFERYDYVVKASFQKSSYDDDLQLRFESLMNFLNM